MANEANVPLIGVPSTAASPNFSTRSSDIVLFGDSITFNNSGLGSDATTKSDRGWFWYANSLYLNNGLNMVQNLGIGGSTVCVHDGSANPFIYRYDKVFDYSPGFVTFMGGINDIQNFTDADSAPEAIFSATKFIVEAFLAANITVFLLTVLPKYSAGPTQRFRNDMAKVSTLNEYLRRWAITKAGVVLVDAAAAITDTTATEFIATSTSLGDGLHPGNTGARLIGDVVGQAFQREIRGVTLDRRPSSQGDYLQSVRKQTLTSVVRSANIVTATAASSIDAAAGQTIGVWNATGDTSYNGWYRVLSKPASTSFTYASQGPDGSAAGSPFVSDYNQIYANPLFLTTTGGTLNAGTSGTAPGSTTHTVTGGTTAVVSTVPRSVAVDGDNYGNNVKSIVTGAANNEVYTLALPLALYAFKGGDILRAIAGFSVTSMTNVKQIIFGLTTKFDGGTTTTYYAIVNGSNTAPYYQADIVGYVAEVPDFTVPAYSTVNFVNALLSITFSGAGGATVTLGRHGLYVISPNHTDFTT